MDLLAVLVEGPVGLRGARRGGVWNLSLARGGARAIRGVGGVSPGAVSIKFAVDGAAAGACEGLWEAGGHPKRCQGRTFGSFLMRRGGIVKKGCACAAVARKSESLACCGLTKGGRPLPAWKCAGSGLRPVSSVARKRLDEWQ